MSEKKSFFRQADLSGKLFPWGHTLHLLAHNQNIYRCVFGPANWCFTCHLLVLVIFFGVLTSTYVTYRKKKNKDPGKGGKISKKGANQHLGATPKC